MELTNKRKFRVHIVQKYSFKNWLTHTVPFLIPTTLIDWGVAFQKQKSDISLKDKGNVCIYFQVGKKRAFQFAFISAKTHRS